MIDVRVGGKPVFGSMIYNGAWEGLGRVGDLADLTPEAEKARVKGILGHIEKDTLKRI